MSATANSVRVRERLEEYGAATQVRMKEYLRGRRSHQAFGALVADYPERGGRTLRSSLCLATARALGAAPADALNSAVALELLHNAFLVHDDVEDESEERRGRPTLHLSHGTPLAINAGDALAVLSLRPLIDNVGTLGPRLSLRILEEAERMAYESVEGQALELWWRQHNVVDLGESDYLRMVLKKTCWYSTIYPMRVGALIGTRDGVDLDRYLHFGFFLGAAFQIQDDLLNLLGDAARYGKELHGDIWEGKRTLMLIHLLNVAEPEERERLSLVLGKPRAGRTVEEVRWIRERMDGYGSIDYARQVAHGMAGAALHEFAVAFAELPDSPDKGFLAALPTWVIERT
jgi:geranylgeranyl diphosphate synthase type II